MPVGQTIASEPTRKPARPSLLSPVAPPQNHNILDAVVGNSASVAVRPLVRRRVWPLALPMAALGALLVAWSFLDTVFTLSPPTGQLPAATAQSPKSPVEPPVVLPPDKTAQQKPNEETTAASEDPFARLQAPPPPEDGLANSTSPLAMLEAAPAPDSLLPSTKAMQAHPLAAAAPDKSQPLAPLPVKVAKQARPPTQPGDKRAARANTDPDVELIGALMRHLGTESATANARPPQTIADMVKSCQGPDPIETLMCQRRICAGSWGKAEACPLSRAPQTGTPSRPPT